MLGVLFGVLIFCFMINVPISLSLGIASIACLLSEGGQLVLIPQRMVAGINSFPLMAIPFFMMAGTIMERGGVSRRIVNFADTLVGHLKGGLAAVSILACTFFAAISGSTPATAAAVGGLTIPEMKKRGYDDSYSSAVVAASSCLGVIIPPSIPMVLFGTTAGISVGKLLIGGIVPGIFLSLILLVLNWVMSKKYGYPTEARRSFREILHAFREAIWALLMPLIILGGIMSGVFTPTESSCVAVVYGLFVGFFVYKELKPSDLVPLLYKSAVSSAMIMLLIGLANPFGWLMTAKQVPVIVSSAFLAISHDPMVLYVLILILYLILGTFMETSAIILLVVPVVMPIMQNVGVDPIQFGVISVIALAIGMLTPPLGVALFTTCGISKVPMSEIIRKVWPFLLGLIAGLFILAAIPQITTFLPNMLLS